MKACPQGKRPVEDIYLGTRNADSALGQTGRGAQGRRMQCSAWLYIPNAGDLMRNLIVVTGQYQGLSASCEFVLVQV